MSVYVDALRPCLKSKRWPYDFSCHLFSDNEKEVMDFAKRMGLKAEWIQCSRSGLVHFDLTSAKRRKAIRLGAIEVSGKALIEILNNLIHYYKAKGETHETAI